MRSSVTLEWQLINDEQWNALQASAVNGEAESTADRPPANYNRRQRMSGLIGILLLLGILSGASSPWPDRNTGDGPVQANAPKTIGTETRLDQNSDEQTPSTLISSNALDQLVREVADAPRTANGTIRAIELVSDLAFVSVVITPTAEAYRQTHIYRYSASGWTYTEPSPKLWGERRTLVRRHLRFEYHLRDAPAVEQAADEIDTLYGALWSDVGLPPPAGERTIRIIPQRIAAGWRFESESLSVPSPFLLRLPSDISNAEALVQILIDSFVTSAINESMRRRAIQVQWQEVVAGAQSWLHTTYCGARRTGRVICYQPAAHQGTHAALSVAALPLATSDSFALFGYRDHGFDGAALIDYVVAVYGRERLPVLLAALSEQSTWHTLIPAVFGVTAPEFEAGWRAYLRGKAPVGSSP